MNIGVRVLDNPMIEIAQIAQIAQIIQAANPASSLPDIPFAARVALTGNKTLILLAPAATFVVGTLLPATLNKYILPVFSKRARIRKYLRLFSVALAAYQDEFPSRFDSPETKWKGWVSPILEGVANTHEIDPDDPAWKELEGRILNKGLEIVAN